jgi:PadR family transcriptional regulator PadR
MGGETREYLQGTLDLLILKTLSAQSDHGWGVAKRVQEISHDALSVNQGSLYPALQRLELQGLVQSEWRRTEENRRAKYYKLTDLGESRLARETRQWRRFALAVELVLQQG